MKYLAAIIITGLICATIIGTSPHRADKIWLDGYRTQQLENLPAPGVEKVKRPDPTLAVKGGRG